MGCVPVWELDSANVDMNQLSIGKKEGGGEELEKKCISKNLFIENSQ